MIDAGVVLIAAADFNSRRGLARCDWKII